MITSKSRFVALDSLRGVCAILVAIHNFEYPRTPFFKHSSLFVDFFFVLSGFVITHSYMSRLGTWADLWLFVLRRFGRLWPLHIVLLAAFVGLDLIKIVLIPITHAHFVVPQFTSPNSSTAIVKNLFLVQAIGLYTDLSWNVPSWSISTEFWTYILFALLCLSSPTRSPSIAVVFSSIFLGGIIMLFFSHNYLETNSYCAIVRCIYGFLFGHLLYRAGALYEYRTPFATSFELLAVIASLAFVYLSDGPSSIAAPVIFGFTIWVFSHESGSISTLLLTHWPVRLGTWSYSIYMVHWFIRNSISVAAKISGALIGYPIAIHVPWTDQDPASTMNAVLALYLVAVIIVAGLSYKLIEQPGRKYFNQISRRLA